MLTERERERKRERGRERCSIIGLKHHDIITQPQLFSCHIINFIDHISS